MVFGHYFFICGFKKDLIELSKMMKSSGFMLGAYQVEHPKNNFTHHFLFSKDTKLDPFHGKLTKLEEMYDGLYGAYVGLHDKENLDDTLMVMKSSHFEAVSIGASGGWDATPYYLVYKRDNFNNLKELLKSNKETLNKVESNAKG